MAEFRWDIYIFLTGPQPVPSAKRKLQQAAALLQYTVFRLTQLYVAIIML